MTQQQLYRDIFRLLISLILGGFIILLSPYFAQALSSSFAGLAIESAGVAIMALGFANLVARIAHPYFDARPVLDRCSPAVQVALARVAPILIYVVVLWLMASGSSS